MMRDVLLHAGQTDWSIAFRNCAEVADGAAQICHGWDMRVEPLVNGFRDGRLRAVVSLKGDVWHWQALGAPKPRDWERIPPRSAMRALTDVQDALLYWHLAEQHDLIGLHSAAALTGNSLLLMPAPGRAGKSTLMACLARRGAVIYGDDVVMLSRGGSISSFGFSPRLRLPLPTSLSPASRKFITAHSPLASHGWSYLSAADGCVAPLGSRKKVNAIVLLERRDTGPARLSEVGKAATLRALLREHLPKKLPPIDVFNRLHRLAKTMNCYMLGYSDPDDAARLLVREFK